MLIYMNYDILTIKHQVVNNKIQQFRYSILDDISQMPV